MKQYRSLAIFSLVAILFVGYNFMSAQWSAPTATAPGDNTAAPLNVSASTQAKTGNLMANIMAAATSTWSPRYCDELGNNCWDPSTGAPGGGGDGLGIGQTWQSLTATRTQNVWYQNTTSKPISVYIWVSPGDGVLYANTAGVDAGAVQIAGPDNDSGTRDNLFGIIPPGHWYKQTGRADTTWSELR